MLLTITATLHAQDLGSFEKRTTVRKLDNGLTVTVMERAEAPVSSFTTIVNSGSAEEVPGITGPAHTFEHMAFKGTDNVGTSNYTAESAALAKVEEAYAADNQAPRDPVNHDDAKIAEPGAKPTVAGAGAAAAATAPAKPTSSSPAGLALIKKVQSFVGGKAKIDAVVATHSTGSMEAQGPQGPMEIELDSIVKYPDYSHRVVKTPMGEMTLITTPDAAYISGPTGEQDMPASQRAAMRNESRADILSVLKNIDNPKYIFTAGSTEKVGTADARSLTVDADGPTIKWLVEPTSGKILRRVSQSPRGEAVTDYTEWKTFDGITLPVAFTTTTAGQPNGKGTLKSMEINPTIDPKKFDKPVN